MTTMNPDTGKHVSHLNKTSEWMSREVPELRIVPDDLWTAAKSRQKQTRHAMKTAGDVPPKVTALAQALEQPEARTEISEALCGLIDAIVLRPDQGELEMELKGNLAAMLGAAQNAKRLPETGDLTLQVVMVAGARNQQCLQLWRPAA